MKRRIRSDYGRMAEERIMSEWRESDMAGARRREVQPLWLREGSVPIIK